MTGIKNIVMTLFHIGESHQPIFLPYGINPVFTACKHFMCITLMPHIPYDFIIRSIKYIMKSKS